MESTNVYTVSPNILTGPNTVLVYLPIFSLKALIAISAKHRL